jgi:ribosomal protein S18 acetylase RimI-like enzyme
MSVLSVRPAEIKDIPIIIDFIKNLAAINQSEKEVKINHIDLDELLHANNPAMKILIGSIDGIPSGYTSYSYLYSTLLGKKTIYLIDLYVAPSSRGKKLGHTLFKSLCAIADKEKCCRIDWSVHSQNTDAIQFYKKMEAQYMDQWASYRISQSNFLNIVNK